MIQLKIIKRKLTTLRTMLRHSKISYLLRAHIHHFQQRRNQGLFVIDLNADSQGFFAQLNWCLHIYNYCEANKLTPYVLLSGPAYVEIDKGKDWFSYFFYNPSLTQEQEYTIRNNAVHSSVVKHISDLGTSRFWEHKMTLPYATELQRKYMVIQPHIQEKVAHYYLAHLEGKVTLGLHYRGSDKISEAPRISWEAFREKIRSYLNSHPQINSIFVASDEENFKDLVETEFSELSVCHYDDKIKACGNIPPHKRDNVSNYLKGEEALINSLLLSRCDHLLKTPSFLSAWSKIFNPELCVTMVSVPYEGKLWFPDKEILRQQRESSPDSISF